MKEESIIRFTNDAGIFYLKSAISMAWEEVKSTKKEITLEHVPLSLLEQVLEEGKVDISLSYVAEDDQYAEYSADWIHFILDKDTGELLIREEK